MNDDKNRAKHFLPFASLRGFYDLVRKTERVIQPKKELTEDAAQIIQETLSLLRPGMMVKAEYYVSDGYETVEGLVSKIDVFKNEISIVKTKVPICDISDIEIIDEPRSYL